MDSPSPTPAALTPRRPPRPEIGFHGRRKPPTRGQAITELALVAPILIVLLLACIDLGRLFFTNIDVTNSAREAAAYLALNPTASVAQAQTVALQEKSAQRQGSEGSLTVQSINCSAGGVTIACSAAKPGDQVAVTVSEPFAFLTPIISSFMPTSITVTTTAPYAVVPVVTPSASAAPTACMLADFTWVLGATSGSSRPVTFTDQSTGSPTSWSWDFGDGQTSAQQNPVVSLKKNKSFDVTLAVSKSGCSSNVTLTVDT